MEHWQRSPIVYPYSRSTIASCYWPHARTCGTGGACAAIDYLLTPDSEQGCSLEVTDNDGNTAWHVAAEGGHLEAVQCLLKEGASMESTNAAGCSQSLPIHLLFPMCLNMSCSYVCAVSVGWLVACYEIELLLGVIRAKASVGQW